MNNKMERTEIEPKCCYGTDGKCYCHNLGAICVCGGENAYLTKECCAYACNNWSVPLEATGIGCRINWFRISCKTNSKECDECCDCLQCRICEFHKPDFPRECCCFPICFPSVLFGNLRYCSSGHICNLSICSWFQQCWLCHTPKDCIC